MSTALTGSGEAGQGGGTPPAGAGNPGAANTTPPPAATPPSGGQASWRDTLPDDLKGNVSLQQFSDVTNLAKSYLHAQSLVGKKGVVVPGEKATDEEWGKFYKDIGVPEADKYGVEAPKESTVDQDFFKGFKEQAHKAGLLPKQAQGLLNWYLGQEGTIKEKMEGAQKQRIEQGLTELKKEWGQGYDKEVAKARAAVKEFGDEKLTKYLNDSGLGNDPMLIRLLAKAGAVLGEDKIRGDGGGRMGKTPAEIQREINVVMGNPGHPYFDQTHPGHKQAIADMSEMYKALSQGQSS
jgi:hypothetical protein